ncbi:MAG: hypothetical protein AB1830_14130 [Pseudomonadota bacterium]
MKTGLIAAIATAIGIYMYIAFAAGKSAANAIEGRAASIEAVINGR